MNSKRYLVKLCLNSYLNYMIKKSSPTLYRKKTKKSDKYILIPRSINISKLTYYYYYLEPKQLHYISYLS